MSRAFLRFGTLGTHAHSWHSWHWLRLSHGSVLVGDRVGGY